MTSWEPLLVWLSLADSLQQNKSSVCQIGLLLTVRNTTLLQFTHLCLISFMFLLYHIQNLSTNKWFALDSLFHLLVLTSTSWIFSFIRTLQDLRLPLWEASPLTSFKSLFTKHWSRLSAKIRKCGTVNIFPTNKQNFLWFLYSMFMW